MRKLILLIAILTFSFSSYSQKGKSIFNIGENSSWYISTSTNLTIFDANYGIIGNTETGVHFTENLSLGMFYSYGIYGLVPDGYSEDDGFKNYMDLGGLSFTYLFKPQDKFQPSLFLRSGFGNFALENLESAEFVNISIYTFSPGLAIEYSLNSYIKLGLQTCYRKVSPVNLSTLGETKLSGTELGISIKFGSF